MKGTTIFSDFLTCLGVPHTGEYSDSQFRTMSFKSLFGFSRLLDSYGVENEAAQVSDKGILTEIATPFLAQLGSGFVIVTSAGPDRVDYIYYHDRESLPAAEFKRRWSGVVLRAFPSATSEEPQYGKHHFRKLADTAKEWILTVCVAFLAVTGFIMAGLGRNLSETFLVATDAGGLAVCWLLILKSLRIKSHAADRMCGILQKHGCDTVLEQKASTFFGLVRWSEVGLSYFTVSTLVLFIFPDCVRHLALINGCCLPFTVWSISYQKFRIKAWCTLCVTVQCLLWCQFFCFLFGGWWNTGILDFSLPLWMMLAAYVAGVLGLNRLMNYIERKDQ